MTAVSELPPFNFGSFTDTDLADPYPIYRRYREHDPVHRVPATGPNASDSWFAFRYDDVSAALADPGFGRGTATRPTSMVPDGYPALAAMVGNWLVFMDPPRHTELRNLLRHEFTPRRIEAVRGEVTDIATGLADRLPVGETFDLVESFCAPFPIMVISRLLGVPWGRLDWFRDVVARLREGISSRVGRRIDGYQIAENATRELVDYFADELARRRRSPLDDILTRLVQTADSTGAINDEEITATAVHLLVAGHETTTNFLSKAVLTLAAHPALADHLRAEPNVLPVAVEELLRYDPPVQMVTRLAHRPLNLGARYLPEGARMVLVLGSANRDPAQYADPDMLSFTRAGVRHRAFAAGSHFCLGAPLARLEAEAGLQVLVTRRRVRPSGGRVTYAKDIVFHGPSVLPARAESSSTTEPIRSPK